MSFVLISPSNRQIGKEERLLNHHRYDMKYNPQSSGVASAIVVTTLIISLMLAPLGTSVHTTTRRLSQSRSTSFASSSLSGVTSSVTSRLIGSTTLVVRLSSHTFTTGTSSRQRSRTTSPSAPESSSATRSTLTFSGTVRAATSTLSLSALPSASKSGTSSGSLSTTTSVSRTYASPTLSATQHRSVTAATPTLVFSFSQSAPTKTDEATSSSSPTFTATASGTFSFSQSAPTFTATSSSSLNLTTTASGTSQLSQSAPTDTATSSSSPTFTTTASGTSQLSPTKSNSVVLTASPPITATKQQNATHSMSQSQSASTSHSATDGSLSLGASASKTATITPPPTPTPTESASVGSVTDAGTLSMSWSSSYTFSPSLSATNDVTRTANSLSLTRGTNSQSRSASAGAATASVSRSATRSPSVELTASARSLSPSQSIEMSVSKTRSLPLTKASTSVSATATEQLTLTIFVTSTHVPTPSDTLLTSCPDCIHGTCTSTAPFVCQCFLSYKLGFWAGGEVQGAICADCVANFYGPSCKNSCPGGVCTPCNNHGTCDDGVSGTGACTCFANTTEGMWVGTSCDRCASGYYGSECKGVCDCVTGAGTCVDGVTGDGSCVCASGRTGTRCESCTTGFYLLPNSTSCGECPGYSASTGACYGNGVCDPSTGICYCNGLYTQTSNCELTDPNAVNGCDASCTANNGTCLYDVCTCPTGQLGTNCAAYCPMTTIVTNLTTNTSSGNVSHSTTTLICNGKGSCDYDSVHDTAYCSCYANDTVGYYDVSTNCSSCVVGYGGSSCQTACPTASNGAICNYISIPNGAVADLCNATTGACNCPTGYCGDNCSLSTRSDGECLCDAANLFGPFCNTTCVNGTTLNYQNASGRCICDAGFVGASCDVKCGCLSNATGTCPYQNNTCVCHAGRAGPTCSIVCPLNSVTNDICSGNGVCNEGSSGDGRCICSAAYVGEACQTPCQCVNSSLGSCQSDGKCVCDTSTWRVGDDCGSCEDGRCGYDCRTQCVNGTTSGTDCICQPTFGGTGCNQQCPTSPTNNLLCSGNGNCSEGSVGTGACVCNEGYIGPYCNCTNAGCAASRGSNSVCNATTGTCSCVLPFGGDDCSTCATGYWGYSCINVCSCVHGTCNRITGTCTCYSDSVNGYWTGSLCSACVSGYNLPDCIQAVAVSTQIPSYQSIYLKGKLYYTAKKLLVLEDYDVTVAIGPVIAVYQNISQSIPTLMQQVSFSSMVAFSSTGACVYAHSWVASTSPTLVVDSVTGVQSLTYDETKPQSVFIAQLCELSTNNTYNTIVVQEYPVLPLANFFSSAQLNASRLPNATFNITVPQLEALVVMKSLEFQGSDYLAAAVTVIVSGNSVNALYAVNFNATQRVLQRQITAFALSSNLEATVSTVTEVDYDPIGEAVILVGSYDASGVSTTTQQARTGFYVLTFSPVPTTGLTTRVFLSQYTLCSYAVLVVVNHTAEAIAARNGAVTLKASSSPSVSVLLMVQVSNGTQDLIRINLTNGASTVSYSNRATLASADTAVTSVYDSLTGMLWVICNNAKTIKIVKVFLCASSYVTADGNGVDMIGSQLLPAITGADRRVIDMQASFVSRQLHLLLQNATGTVVRRFLMYDNTNIFPSTLSRSGSPSVTITGRGYLNGTGSAFFPTSVPRCRITSGTVKYYVNARIVNQTQLVCPLSASNTSLCNSDSVDVALFGDYFTTTALAVPRYQQSVLSAVSPTTTPLTATLSAVSVIGSGFVDSGVLLCQYTPENATSTSFAATTTSGTYISPSLILCDPPALTQAVRLYVNVACDGMVFTETTDTSINLIAVVGALYNITTSVTSVIVTSALVVPLPSIVVSFVDDQSSSLGSTVTDRIQVAVSFQGGLVADGTLTQVNNVGVFTFSAITLVAPLSDTGTAITFVATLLSGQATLWSARVPITINSGAPHSLWLTNTPTTSAGIPESNRITLIEATVVDIAGNSVNTLTSSSSTTNDTTINATLSLQYNVAPNVVLPPALLTVYPADEFQNVSQAFQSGVVSYSTLSITNARGGLLMWFLIETNLTNADGVRLVNQTAPLVPKCNAGKLRFLGDTSCSSCPSNMNCPTPATDDGNATLLVTVDPGYARSSVYATEVTACQPTSACVGGLGTGGCAAGYTGVLCGLCESSTYGRSTIGGNCVACYGSSASGFLLFVCMLLVMCAALVLLTVCATQNWSITIEPVVSLVLLLHHLHSVMGLGLTGFTFSQYFKDGMSYMGMFSARVLDYYFSDCVLSGVPLYSKIAAYAAMPVVALLLASVAWLAVFISPDFLRFHTLHSARDSALRERRDELLRRLAKHQASRRAVATRHSGGAIDDGSGAVDGGRARTFFLKETPSEHLRRITDQAEIAAIELELKKTLKTQGVLPQHDYRVFAAHAMQVTMLFTLHTIISYSLSVFNCEDVSSGLGTVTSYLMADFRVSCDVDAYRQFSGFAYAVSLLYGAAVPMMVIVLYKMHLRLRPAKVLQRRQVFYVFTIGLKTGSWYWSTVTLFRKAAQFAIAALVPAPNNAQVIVWLFVVQLVWLINLRPYWNASNTLLEAVSLVSCIIAGSLCILLEAYSSEPSQDAISGVVLTVMLAPIPLFVFSATQKVWQSVREEVRALRYDSEQESSSASDDEAEVHKDVVAAFNSRKKGRSRAQQQQQLQLLREGPADDVVNSASPPRDGQSVVPKKHILRNVSIAEYFRAEDETREAREKAQQSLEVQLAWNQERHYRYSTNNPHAHHPQLHKQGNAAPSTHPLAQRLLFETPRSASPMPDFHEQDVVGEPQQRPPRTLQRQQHHRHYTATSDAGSYSSSSSGSAHSTGSAGSNDIPALVPTFMTFNQARHLQYQQHRDVRNHRGGIEVEGSMDHNAFDGAGSAFSASSSLSSQSLHEDDRTGSPMLPVREPNHDGHARSVLVFRNLEALDRTRQDVWRHGADMSITSDLFDVL